MPEPRLNAYFCRECRNVLFTIQHGTAATPFLIGCEFCPDRPGQLGPMAESAMGQLRAMPPALQLQAARPNHWREWSGEGEYAKLHKLKGPVPLELFRQAVER